LILSHLVVVQEAEECLGRALSLAPGFPEAQFTRGCCLLGLGRFLEAAPCFAAAVHGLPDDGQVWANLAVALRSAELPDQALVAAQQAARLLPSDWRVQHNLLAVSLLCHPPRHQLAVEAARRLVVLAREAPNAEAGPGDRLPLSTLEQLIDCDARHLPVLLDECCALWPAEPALYAFRAAMLERRGDPRSAALDAGRAARLLRAKLQQDPEDKERLRRVLGAMRRHHELLVKAGDDAAEERVALAAAAQQLADRYGDTVLPEILGDPK
jgi:tetratricopeptide (TPR) repeat protein